MPGSIAPLTSRTKARASRAPPNAAREVILSGGAFNTPQLLMLSGIGPEEQLAKHDIPVRVNLPGVGQNLQDRYEVGITNRLRQDWTILKGATFTRDDPQCKEWARWRKGVYTTNGAAFAAIKRSLEERPLPDLFVFALIGKFAGYHPGYSKIIADEKNYLTWCILKAHTENHGGTVELRSADPRDPPEINFHYFKEGTDKNGDDLASVVAGVKFVRTLTETRHRTAASLWRRNCPARRCRPTSSSANSCKTMPGATTPPAPARSGGRAIRRPCSTAISASTA